MKLNNISKSEKSILYIMLRIDSVQILGGFAQDCLNKYSGQCPFRM